MNRPFLTAAALAAGITVSCGDNDGAVLGNETPVTLQVEFQDLRVEEISEGRAVARFSTSLPTTCEVEYGLTATALDLTAQDPTMGPIAFAIDHQVPLESLQPGTEYHWRARGTTADGETFRSGVLTFTTLDAAIDDLQLVNIGTIAQGASVAGMSGNFGGAANDQTWGAACHRLRPAAREFGFAAVGQSAQTRSMLTAQPLSRSYGYCSSDRPLR